MSNRCYWCQVKVGKASLETRFGMLRYWCSIHHAKRFFNINYTEEEFNSVKIFVSTDTVTKYVGLLSEFFKYEK